jgi:tetratricopeptide (TPR) repeat protein
MSAGESLPKPGAQRPPNTCTLQPYPGLSPTVSVRSLEVQNDYERACDALKSHKFAESEKHLRKALQRSSLDAFGWVMLGKVLELMERLDEASKACTEAVLHDPSYWPGTVCLAEIDAKKKKWRDSLEESDRALSLSPDCKRIAYYISAVALYNLNHVQEAESRALEAERLDGAHEILPLRLLLAQINEVKGDWHAAVAQLRDCLTYANKSLEGKLAKQELARLGSVPN